MCHIFWRKEKQESEKLENMISYQIMFHIKNIITLCRFKSIIRIIYFLFYLFKI